MTKTFSIVRTAAVALFASGFVTLTPVAHAADQAPQGELNIAGTDFTSAKAVSHLVARLHRVALDICLADSGQHVAMSVEEGKCVDTAVKNGLAQIESKRQEAMRETSVHVAAAQPATAPTH